MNNMNILTKFKQKYKKLIVFGKKVAAFQIRILFSGVYYLFILPFALILSLITKKEKSGWKKINYSDDLKDAGRQF